MTERANHTIVVGEGADAKTILAGAPLPDGLPADEIKRLRELGAIGPQQAPNPAAPETLIDEGVARTEGLPIKTAANAPPGKSGGKA